MSSISKKIDELFQLGIHGANFREMVATMARHGIVCMRSKFSRTYLSGLGFSPATVIDVGVNNGTPALYTAHPEANLILVDPLEAALTACAAGLKGRKVATFACAAGSISTKTTLNIMKISGHSTLLQSPREEPTCLQIVDVQTLDELVARSNFTGPYALKIDTEGYELEVLRGAKHTIRDCQYVIAELSIKKIFKDGYRFSDAISEFAERGFQLFDILNASGSPPNHFDCLFIPESDVRRNFISG